MSPTKLSAKSASKSTAKSVAKSTSKSTAKRKTKKSPTTQEKYLGLRTSLDPEVMSRAFADNLFYLQGRIPQIATLNDYYMAAAYTIRDRMLQRWLNTVQPLIEKKDTKVIAYLSAEFLMGPHMGNNLINLGIYQEVSEALTELGQDLEELIDQEVEPGLGNGGLGRLDLGAPAFTRAGPGARAERGPVREPVSVRV